MAKLTQWQRDRVRAKIMSETFAPRGVALKKREAALAVRVIVDRYGRNAFARFDAVPAGWLTTSNKIRVRRGTSYHYLVLEEARALPHELVVNNVELDERPALAARMDDLLKAQAQLYQDREKLSNDLKSALAVADVFTRLVLIGVQRLAQSREERLELGPGHHALLTGLAAFADLDDVC